MNKANNNPLHFYQIKRLLCILTLGPGISLFSIVPNSLPTISSDYNESKIIPNQLDTHLLEMEIIRYTNFERKKYQLKPLSVFYPLRKAANRHSREMATLHYFSHQSPTQKNQDLTDRLENAGFQLINVTVGENIGVDYFLRIANIPFYTTTLRGKTYYINADNGKSIDYQTYQEFAKRMVRNWMKSPGHRKNILNPQYERIGCGIAAGIYQGMKAIYVTQNFSGSLRPSRITYPNR